MRLILIPVVILLCSSAAFAQKKPLDHTVYDGWQSITERRISADGRWAVYVVDVQEGDGELVIQRTDDSYRKTFPRGYNVSISPDSRYAVFRIKPRYADVRQARIKKVKPDDMPKDSLAVVRMGTDSVFRYDRVKSYKLAERGASRLAILRERIPVDTARKAAAKDSLRAAPDTLKRVFEPVVPQKPDAKRKRQLSVGADEEIPYGVAETVIAAPDADAEGDEKGAGSSSEGTELVLHDLETGAGNRLKPVTDYVWSRNGKWLAARGTASKSAPGSSNTVVVWRAVENRFDTVARGANDYRNMAIDDAERQLAFVAERDSSSTPAQKAYRLHLWKNGYDSAVVLAGRNSPGMPLHWTVSEHAPLSFSKSGQKLFFGTAPMAPLKDTTLVDIDLVKLDVWHYGDEYLQPQQLKMLEQEQKRSYLAVHHLTQGRMVQLADRDLPVVSTAGEGDAETFPGYNDKPYRLESQWRGRSERDVYAVNVNDGSRTLVAKGLNGTPQSSPQGRYLWWYDASTRHYHTWADGKTQRISGKVPTPLYDEEFDMPDDPGPYGAVRWLENDEALLVYDRYDIWQLDPLDRRAPVNLTAGAGRKSKTSYRYIPTDPEERFIRRDRDLLLRAFDERDKRSGLAVLTADKAAAPVQRFMRDDAVNQVLKAKEADTYLFTRETFSIPPDLYASNGLGGEVRLSRINPQQSAYSWGTAELFKWKAYDGREATGILYKPEGFEPGRKYPLIAYFYEKLSDDLHRYNPPAPTPSRLNISFYVSRGYLVLAPDISYTKGYPGRSAYDHVVSGVRAVVKRGWADSTKLGLQGQSWGGYQALHIITRTPLFRAAWAGAPVANMTSAYGGIRWESGLNRQFQYEHSQSRIGASLWEKPNLYMENSPLFHLKSVKTPLVVMANDADGAVPWYQGIELFTAMRRLNKQVWMLNYNGEAHNLVERRNRKDIQVRQQQFFDWLLKGEKPSRWISQGVPAVDKGRDWGLGY